MTAGLGPARVPESEIDDRCKNIAYAVQDVCETAMMNVVKMQSGKRLPQRLSCRRRGAEFESERENLASGLVDQFFRAAGCLG